MAAEKDRTEMETESKSKSKNTGTSVSIVDGLRIIAGLLLLNSLVSYLVTGELLWKHNPWWARPQALSAWLQNSSLAMTDAELAKYSGANASLPIYLAVNGTLFDVTAGRRFYGPGGPYQFFAGRDASRAYVSGCFKEDANPDVRGVEWMHVPTDVARFTEVRDEDLGEAERNYRYEMVEAAVQEVEKTLAHWSKVFSGETGRDYFEVGRVVRSSRAMERLPMKALCPSAERKRPGPKFDAGKTYEGTMGYRVKKVKKQQLDAAKLHKGKERNEL